MAETYLAGCFVPCAFLPSSATIPPPEKLSHPVVTLEAMHETSSDLADLQDMIDRSYAAAGSHLLEIHTPARRLSAAELSERLQGMCLLVLASVTADGRPLTGPVDGVFYRGSFHFGSSPESFRFRHIAARPSVSATHLPAEELAVTVHGTAEMLSLRDPANAGYRQTLLDIYVPRYGDSYEQWVDGMPAARINADRVFAFHMPEGDAEWEPPES